MYIFHVLVYLSAVSGIKEEIIQRLAQASYKGSYKTPIDQNYHNRSKYQDFDDLKFRRLFGVTSLSLKKAAHGSRGISYRTNATATFEHWAPRRSTISPILEVSEDIPDVSQVNENHSHFPSKFSGKRNSRKIKQITKGVKGFAPAEVDQEAVKLLEEVLRNEKVKLRHNIIIRKIKETKEDVRNLEKRLGKPNLENLKKIKRKGEVVNDREKILQTQLAIQKKLNEADQLKYTIREGVLFKEGNIPIARVTGNRPKTKMYSFNTIHASEQTKVESSNIVVEGTTTLLPNSLSKNQRDEPNIFPSSSNQLMQNTQGNNSDSLDLKSTEISNDNIENTKTPPPYPFSHCYMNIDGFICCNRYLESLIRKSYQRLKNAKRFNDCSIQKISNELQEDAQEVFNTPFETIVALDDFALRAHFAGDLMCKLIEDGHFITLYATAMPAKEGVKLDPLHVITPLAIDVKNGQSNISNTKEVNTSNINNIHLRRSTELKIPFHELSREDIDNERMLTNVIMNKS